MEVLLLTDSYPPEIRSSSHLMFDLATGLRDRGHRVSVLTCHPRYNLAGGARRELSRARGACEVTEEGIRVIRVDARDVHNCGPIRRGIAFLRLPIIAMLGGRRWIRRLDAIIHYSPPLTLGLAAIRMKRELGARYIMNVQDIFPQNAIELGVLRNPAAIRFFRLVERHCYGNADQITCHSEGNRDLLRKRLVNGKPVSVILNWVDPEEYDRPPRPELLARMGLGGKFVLMFAGVMGYAQGLHTVVDCARLLQGRPEIAFLLVGDGVQKRQLVRQARGLRNVHFHPFVSREAYARLARTVEVGLVTLHPSMATPVVPSKVLTYMAAGKPWIASVNDESDARLIAERAGCALVCRPGDPESMASKALELYGNRQLCREMGEKGRRYCEENFSKSKCIDEYDNMLSEFASRGFDARRRHAADRNCAEVRA